MKTYEFKCGICGKITIRDNLDEFTCLCDISNKPIGLKYYHHCLECNNYYWGSSQAECTQCIAGRLSEKKVSIEKFGDAVNTPTRNPDRDWEFAERTNDRLIQARKEVQDLKALEQRSVIQTAKYLKEISIKLDSLLERQEFEC